MLPTVKRGGSKPGDLRLLRAVEAGIAVAPKATRQAFDESELVNAVWLICKRRGIRRPTKLQVRCAAIDYHRSVTHFRDNGTKSRFRNRYPNVLSESNIDPWKMKTIRGAQIDLPRGENRTTIVDYLRSLRAKAGYRGVCQFLLTDVIGLAPELTGQVLED